MSGSKPSDPLCGLKSFSIGGRMVQRRQRCLGMTEEERRWRAQWLKDQVLSEEEPRFSPEYYKDTHNFFRRIWKTPYEKLERSLQPTLGVTGASFMRELLGRGMVFLGMFYIGCYFIKYHANDFTTWRTVEVGRTCGPMHPSDPNYPNYEVAKPSDYYDQGFYSSVLCQDVEIPPPPPPPEAAYIPDPDLCPGLSEENAEPDFTTWRTVEVGKTRGPMHPSDPNYPNYEVKKPADYYDQGFYSSVLAKKF